MSLSSNKKSQPPLKKVKNLVIRNLLCAPKEDEWPRLTEEETDILKAELKKNLSSLNVPKIKKPWREIRNEKKEKRRALKKEFDDNLPSEYLKSLNYAKQLRSWLFLGLNAVSRAIESDAVACCLVAEDVSPLTLVKHVVQLANHAKIPVFLVDGFKGFCNEVMGFRCIAMGIAKPSTPSGDVSVFHDVCRLTEKFHLDWTKRRNPAQNSILGDFIEEDAAPAGKHHSTTQTTTTVTTADAQESCDFLSCASSFHLMRRSKYERAFTPEVISDEIETDTSLPEKSLPKKSPPKNRMKYKLPTILRVRNNPFKLKRKKKKKKTQ